MEKDAFTAGVVPGGLTTEKEIKILVCVVLSGLSAPLLHSFLLESLTDDGLVNYFEACDAVADLLEQGNIAAGDDGYTITDTGRSIAQLLSGDVPLTVRERATKRAFELLRRQINMSQHIVDIEKRDNGYQVRGSISDCGSEVFAVEVYAPSQLDALKIRQNFIDNGEEIMRAAYENLTAQPK